MDYDKILPEFRLQGLEWGVGLGVVFGFLYNAIVFSLATFGIFGIFYGFIGGLILGLLNGVVLGRKTRKDFYPLKDRWLYRDVMVRTACIQTFIVSLIIYFVLLLPFAGFGAIVFAIPACIIATLCAAYASKKLAKWYASSFTKVKNDA